MIQKSFSCKNKHYIVIVPVPNLYLSAWSSLFIMYFFYVYGEPFKKHPGSARNSYRKRHCCSILSQDGHPAVFIWMPPRHSDSGYLENWTKNSTIPRAQERVSERASERDSERSGARKRSEQCVASERKTGASERGSGWASGPILTSQFLDILNILGSSGNDFHLRPIPCF